MVCARHVFVAPRSAEATCHLYHKYKHTKSWVVEALWRQPFFFSPAQQRLNFVGKQLHDDRTLAGCNI